MSHSIGLSTERVPAMKPQEGMPTDSRSRRSRAQRNYKPVEWSKALNSTNPHDAVILADLHVLLNSTMVSNLPLYSVPPGLQILQFTWYLKCQATALESVAYFFSYLDKVCSLFYKKRVLWLLLMLRADILKQNKTMNQCTYQF